MPCSVSSTQMWKEVKYARKILEQPDHQRALGSCTEIQKDSTLELEGTLAMAQSTSLRQRLAQGHRTGPCQSKDERNLETKLPSLFPVALPEVLFSSGGGGKKPDQPLHNDNYSAGGVQPHPQALPPRAGPQETLGRRPRSPGAQAGSTASVHSPPMPHGCNPWKAASRERKTGP